MNPAGLQAGLAAGDAVRAFAAVLGGRGGDSADVAQGAGGDRGRLPAAMTAARSAIAQTLGAS